MQRDHLLLFWIPVLGLQVISFYSVFYTNYQANS
jgi:hypothetical protein